MSLLDQITHFLFNGREGLSQGTGKGQIRIKSSEAGSEDRAMQACEEQSYFAAIGCDPVAMGIGNSPDDTLQAQTTQVIRQLAGRVR